MKRAITYCRKSTTNKRLSEEQGVMYQMETIEQYSKFHQMEIVKAYSDVGYSGRNTERPELQEMLYDLRTKQIVADVLLIYSVDRFGRDLKGNITTMFAIADLVKEVIFVTENFSSSSILFKPMFLTLTSHAQIEAEKLLKRMEDGRKAKIFNRKNFDGSWLPLGYVLCQENKKDFKLYPAYPEYTDDFTQQLELFQVQFIFYSFLLGKNTSQIAKLLNKFFGYTRRGVPWTYKAVHYILSNPAYIGTLKGCLEKKLHFNLEDSNIVPIIEEYLFALVQMRLDNKMPHVLNRYPTFNLCMYCGSSLVRFHPNTIGCNKCNFETDLSFIYKAIKERMSFEIWKDERDIEGHLFRLKKKYELKINKQIKRLVQLKQRKMEIEKMLLGSESISFNKMLEINTYETVIKEQEIQIDSEIYKVLNMDYFKSVSTKAFKTLPHEIIGVPFIIIVDFIDKKADLYFYYPIINLEKGA
jgi:DNA invertase Pin-like site-specific DNA recombinase